MPKVTDEELDRLFRDAAESTHPEFDSVDWDDMSQKLAREEKAAKARNRTLYSVVTLLILYTLWSPFGDKQLQIASMNPLDISELSTTEKSNETTIHESDNSQPSAQATVESKDNNGSATNSSDKVKSPAQQESAPLVTWNDKSVQSKTKAKPVTTEVIHSKINDEANVASGLDDANLKATSTPEVTVKSELTNVTESTEGKTKDANAIESTANSSETDRQLKLNSLTNSGELPTEDSSKDNIIDNSVKILPTVKNEVVEVNKGAEKSASENKEDVDNGGFKSLAAPPSVDNQVTLSRGEITHEFPTLSSIRERKLPLLLEHTNEKKAIEELKTISRVADPGEIVVKKDAIQSNHPLFIKLPVSPDFSSIDYGSTGKTGINIGLLGEYYLTKHFSVSTGAIWSKKLYDQNNPNKIYDAGTWTAKVNRLDGDCRVLDIPINVTYYLFPDRRTNFFITAGSSSYIMLNEDYKYTVWKNQQYMTYDQSVSHKNNEWFSMLNVSIGIQQRVGERFMLQVEPFLKAPMSGVGEGKVNLVSTGAFVSLKYKLIR